MLFLRDRGPTEIGGFGIAPAEDLLFVEEFALIDQQATPTFVRFDDRAVADFFDQQIDQGRRPEQCGRIWIHTHPGDSATPSIVDRETFERVFGRCDWAVMAILARGGATHAELFWRQGGFAALPLRVEVDFQRPFAGTDHDHWEAEYQSLVQPMLDCVQESGRSRQREKNAPSLAERVDLFNEELWLPNHDHHPLAWEIA